jgi:hypothetical protein
MMICFLLLTESTEVEADHPSQAKQGEASLYFLYPLLADS